MPTTGTDRSKESLLLAMHRSVSDSTLTQGQRPQFVQRPPLEVNVYESEPLTLRCVVEGTPKPIGMPVMFLLTTRLLRPAIECDV